METLSETQKRNTKIDQDGPKRKVIKGGDTSSLAFFGRKGRKRKRGRQKRKRRKR